jgi:hypothetical protein
MQESPGSCAFEIKHPQSGFCDSAFSHFSIRTFAFSRDLISLFHADFH